MQLPFFCKSCNKAGSFSSRKNEVQIATMEAKLGKKATKWSGKGVDFLSLRSRGKGQDGELAEKVVDMYVRGDLEKVPKDINHKAAQAFNRGMLDAESIAVLLLGRKPKKTPDGMQEHGVKLTPAEIAAQKVLADAMTGGECYINKQRGKNTTSHR